MPDEPIDLALILHTLQRRDVPPAVKQQITHAVSLLASELPVLAQQPAPNPALRKLCVRRVEVHMKRLRRLLTETRSLRAQSVQDRFIVVDAYLEEVVSGWDTYASKEEALLAGAALRSSLSYGLTTRWRKNAPQE